MTEAPWKNIKYKYRSGDLFLIVLLMSSIKYLTLGNSEFAIYSVLLMILHEIHRRKDS